MAQKAADEKLTELLGKLDKGEPTRETKDTLKAWLETWRDTIVAVRNAPLTQQSYRNLSNKHIIPALGSMALKDLKPTDVDRMLANIVAPVEEGGKGLSANTAHHVYTCLHKAIKDAVRKGKLYRNVCEQVDPPSPGKYKAKIPPAEGVAKVLALAREKAQDLAPLFTFCAYTGTRRGEACGLRWEHVDFEHKVVTIKETVQRIPKKGLVVLPPKGDKTRDIALDDDTVAMLREHQGKQLLRKVELGGTYQDEGIVFAGPTGKHTDPNLASHTWQRLRDEAGYPGLKLHGLRHAHAHGLIRAGVHAKVIQERLGHHSAAFTLDVYGDGGGLQGQAAAAFADLMKKAAG